MVSQGTMAAMTTSMVLSIVIPLLLLIFAKWKYGISLKVVFAGMFTFILFAQVLEGVLNVVLFSNETAGSFLNKAWVYVPYGSLMAGLFEETGRFLVFTFMLKKAREWKDGLAFGIGHGGIESILVLGLSNVSMLIYAQMINAGTFEDLFVNEAMKESLLPIQEQLLGASASMFYLGIFERVCAITLHIALSILIVYGISKNRKRMLVYAILIHSVFNIPAALYQKGIITNSVVLEAIIAVFAVICAYFIVRSKREWFQSHTPSL